LERCYGQKEESLESPTFGGCHGTSNMSIQKSIFPNSNPKETPRQKCRESVKKPKKMPQSDILRKIKQS
jgi:hypothetical protein